MLFMSDLKINFYMRSVDLMNLIRLVLTLKRDIMGTTLRMIYPIVYNFHKNK